MNFARELRFALRRLARRPAVSALAIALLAVGFGGNLALLGVLDAILFRQAPIVEPERLVRIVRTDAERSVYDNWSFPTADDLRRGVKSLAGAAIFADWRSFHVQSEGRESVRVSGSLVTANYFDLLGLRPAAGRLLTPEDDKVAGGSDAVVLAHDLWRTRFDADRGVIGATVRLNGHAFTVVGVAPRGFGSLDPSMSPQIWVPMAAVDRVLNRTGDRVLLAERGSSWLDLVGRLAPGASVASAQAELDATLAALAAQYPDSLMVEAKGGVHPANSWVMSIDDARVGGPSERPRVERQATLVAAVGALSLFAVAANLAALVASRASQSRHETAVRAALGASRPRLALPLVAEGLLLTVAGALAAPILAGAVSRFARTSLGFVLPLAGEPTLDLIDSPRLLAAGAALVVLTVLLVGAAPGLSASRLELVPALRREGPARRRGGLAVADALIVAQVALSVVLLAVATLLVGRFRELAKTPTGFEPAGVVQAWYDLGLQGYSPERATAFHAELQRRAEAALGAGNVALADWTPLEGGWSRTSIVPDGYTAAEGEIPNADVSSVTPSLLRVLGGRLVRGRFLDERDAAGAPLTAVINEEMAKKYFPGRDALGAVFRTGGRAVTGPPITVAGVVADLRYRDLTLPQPAMFFQPLAQDDNPQQSLALLARADEPAAALGTVRTLLRELDPELPLFRAGRLDEQARASLDDERRAATLFAGFAGLVLTLAAAGLAALALGALARRRREIGVRVALGAEPRSVLGLFLGHMARLVAIGAAAGVVVTALLLPRLGDIAGAAAEIDAAKIVLVLGVLSAAAALATWLPARRALSIEPAETLRAE